jgi:hypothetical protein
VKAVGVIPDPETFIFELEPVDRFMILGIISVYSDWGLSYSSVIFAFLWRILLVVIVQ